MYTAILKRVLPLPATVVALAAMAPLPPVSAQPFGPDTCINGFVWREAAPGDNVCVTPATRDATAAQNAQAVANRDPNGAFGSNSCKQGFVWREAFDGDVVCVTPDVRAATKADNAQAATRKVANAPQQAPAQLRSVLFEVTGSGTVYSIDLDPGGRIPEGTTAPFNQTTAIGPDVSLLQVVVVTKSGSQGCRITVDDTVVTEQAPGDAAHCIAHL